MPDKFAFGLNLMLGIAKTVAITYLAVLPMIGVQVGVIPDWAMTVVK